MTLDQISVRVFMRCLFNKDYTDVPNWEDVYTSYIDYSGIGETKQYHLMRAIHNINVRLSDITAFLELQKGFYLQVGFPFEHAFQDMNKYGYRLNWNANNPQDFINQLQKIETKEKRNIAELDKFNKELIGLQKNGGKEDEYSRTDFVKMINGLRKAGYKIDKDKTDMEEFSLMIKETSEEYQRLQQN